MEQDIFGDFINKFEERSPYLSKMLKNDGDMARIVKLVDAKYHKDKVGYMGVITDVVTLKMIVDTPDGECEKIWDAKVKFIQDEIVPNKIGIGSSFIITRKGAAGDTKTKYEISDVRNANSATPEDIINE